MSTDSVSRQDWVQGRHPAGLAWSRRHSSKMQPATVAPVGAMTQPDQDSGAEALEGSPVGPRSTAAQSGNAEEAAAQRCLRDLLLPLRRSDSSEGFGNPLPSNLTSQH